MDFSSCWNSKTTKQLRKDLVCFFDSIMALCIQKILPSCRSIPFAVILQRLVTFSAHLAGQILHPRGPSRKNPFLNIPNDVDHQDMRKETNPTPWKVSSAPPLTSMPSPVGIGSCGAKSITTCAVHRSDSGPITRSSECSSVCPTTSSTVMVGCSTAGREEEDTDSDSADAGSDDADSSDEEPSTPSQSTGIIWAINQACAQS